MQRVDVLAVALENVDQGGWHANATPIPYPRSSAMRIRQPGRQVK